MAARRPRRALMASWLAVLALACPSASLAQATGSPYSGEKPKVATAAQAQQPNTKELDAVRAQMKAGQPQEALDALAGMAPTADVWRLRVQASLDLGRTSAAVEAYDGLARTIAQEDKDLLRTIAVAVVRGTLASPDASLAIEACSTLLQRGADPCSAKLAKDAADSTLLFATRAAALGALARSGDAKAAAQLRALASGATGQQQRAIVDAVRDLDDRLAVPILASALASGDAGIQYSAANALGSRRGPQARAALEKFLAGNPDPVARGAARFSLARLGDPRWQKEFVAILPELDGDMSIEVGEWLLEQGDPRGAAAIEKVAKGQHEPLRLAAAVRLPPASSDLATSVLGAALTSENPWTRALALQVFRDSPVLPLHVARRSLADTEPWVRLRAAQGVFARLSPDSAGAASKRR